LYATISGYAKIKQMKFKQKKGRCTANSNSGNAPIKNAIQKKDPPITGHQKYYEGGSGRETKKKKKELKS